MDDQRWKERAGSFGDAADVYERSRPTYPVEAVRAALPVDAARVLDLGAGTGKLTGVLLDLGLDVVAVEPDEQMRALLPARAEVVAGTAEELPLEDASVDAVLVGQAFHWFDAEPALREMIRVLRPGGRLGLLWNVRDESVDWVREVDDLWGADGSTLLDENAPFAPVAGLTAPVREVFEHRESMDTDRLIDLAASRSALLTMPEDERLEVLDRVREAAPDEEPFDLPYRTVVWHCTRQ
jgi:SAM-dependent methyltransferase